MKQSRKISRPYFSKRKTKKKVKSKALKKFKSRVKSDILKKNKSGKTLKSYKSRPLNLSFKDTINEIFRYKIISTLFKNNKTNTYNGYIENIIPNLIIDLDSKQELIIANYLLRYKDDNLTILKTKTNFFSNTSMFLKKVKLISFSTVKNKTIDNLSLCLKPKLPCNIEVLNINENKSYVINPLNILASSTNIDFKLSNARIFPKDKLIMFGIKIFFLVILNIITMPFLGLGVFSLSYQESLTFNMVNVKVNEKTKDKGIVFLAGYGQIKKLIIKPEQISRVRLGQLVAYESTVKVSKVYTLLDSKATSLKDPNYRGIPSNYYVEFKGSGQVYYQTLDYFEYANAQLNMFSKDWLNKIK